MMIDKNCLFKVLKEDGSPCWGGDYSWPLPNKNEPGEWINVVGELEETSNGLHLCRIRALPFWIGPAIFFAEYEGEIKNEDSDTPFVRKARLLSRVKHWDHNTLRDFAKDCYDHAMQQLENNDKINKKLVERFEEIWTGKIYMHIPRQAAELSSIYKDELDWQVNRLSQYLQESSN